MRPAVSVRVRGIQGHFWRRGSSKTCRIISTICVSIRQQLEHKLSSKRTACEVSPWNKRSVERKPCHARLVLPSSRCPSAPQKSSPLQGVAPPPRSIVGPPQPEQNRTKGQIEDTASGWRIQMIGPRASTSDRRSKSHRSKGELRTLHLAARFDLRPGASSAGANFTDSRGN